MSHQWPSKAHLQQGDVAFCNVNILIIITRTGGKNHLYPPLFLIKIMSTSLIKQHCLDMQICSVTHRSHDSLTGFLSCHKISSKKLLITMGSQSVDLVQHCKWLRPTPALHLSARAAPVRPGPAQSSVVSRMSQSEHLSAACPG